jgi:hypothetical protein
MSGWLAAAAAALLTATGAAAAVHAHTIRQNLRRTAATLPGDPDPQQPARTAADVWTAFRWGVKW